MAIPLEKNEARDIRSARAPLFASLLFFCHPCVFLVQHLRSAHDDEFDIRGRRAGRFVQFFFFFYVAIVTVDDVIDRPPSVARKGKSIYIYI